MTDLTNSSDVSEQLAEILRQLADLSQRVSAVEDKLLLVPDINRYGQLQQFLSKGDFKQADLETANVILEAVSKTRETLTPDDMKSFPCGILQVIDNLWRKYSSDRFGFSVQLELYKSVGGSLDTLRTQDKAVLRQFAEKVSWFKDGVSQGDSYDQWEFSTSSAKGCFPAIWWKSPYGLKMVTFCFLRLFECDL
jgi:hypothetical protein